MPEAAARETVSEDWFIGSKDVTAPTNVRTMIAAAIPFAGVGNTLCLVRTESPLRACLLANMNAFALDYIVRQKVGGQHLNFFIVEQFPVLAPTAFEREWRGVRLAEFVASRVLELSYTAEDLRAFAVSLGYVGDPFIWEEGRRSHLRAQLDAAFFLQYGLNRDDARYILSTFPIVRRTDEARYGHYRTERLILHYMAAYEAGDLAAWVAD